MVQRWFTAASLLPFSSAKWRSVLYNQSVCQILGTSQACSSVAWDNIKCVCVWRCAVRHVQLGKDGAPQAILSNRTAWLYHSGLACWLCLADSAFASSPFTSLLPLNPALQGTPPSLPPLLSIGLAGALLQIFDMIMCLHNNCLKSRLSGFTSFLHLLDGLFQSNKA